jgi:hypothetical protein
MNKRNKIVIIASAILLILAFLMGGYILESLSKKGFKFITINKLQNI